MNPLERAWTSHFVVAPLTDFASLAAITPVFERWLQNRQDRDQNTMLEDLSLFFAETGTEFEDESMATSLRVSTAMSAQLKADPRPTARSTRMAHATMTQSTSPPAAPSATAPKRARMHTPASPEQPPKETMSEPTPQPQQQRSQLQAPLQASPAESSRLRRRAHAELSREHNINEAIDKAIEALEQQQLRPRIETHESAAAHHVCLVLPEALSAENVSLELADEGSIRIQGEVLCSEEDRAYLQGAVRRELQYYRNVGSRSQVLRAVQEIMSKLYHTHPFGSMNARLNLPDSIDAGRISMDQVGRSQIQLTIPKWQPPLRQQRQRQLAPRRSMPMDFGDAGFGNYDAFGAPAPRQSPVFGGIHGMAPRPLWGF